MARPPRQLRTHVLLIALSLSLGALTACAIAYLGVIRARWLEERSVVFDIPDEGLLPALKWRSVSSLHTSELWPGMTLASTSLFERDRFDAQVAEGLLRHEALAGRRAFDAWLTRDLMPWDVGQRWTHPVPARSVVAAGWPFLYLWGVIPARGAASGLQVRHGVWILDDDLIVPPSAAAHPRPMPLLPLPARFAAAATLYALPFLAMMHLGRWALLARRRRRGLCPTCAYDLRATPAGSPCPECGNPPR